MQTYTTDAIILKRWNLGEADRVFTLYTANRGRVSALARGVRRPLSRLGGHLELFSVSSLTLREGKTFDLITAAQLTEPHTQLTENVERVHAAHFVAEAILRLTVEESIVDRLFELLLVTYRLLAESKRSAGVLAGFQLKLLTVLGHQPVIDRCVHCQNPFDLERQVAGFDTIEGGFICQDCAREPHHPVVTCGTDGYDCVRKLLLEPIKETAEDYAGFKEANRVVEQALLMQTERPLKSRAFLNAPSETITHAH